MCKWNVAVTCSSSSTFLYPDENNAPGFSLNWALWGFGVPNPAAPWVSPPAACPSNLWLMGHPRAGAILQIFSAAAFPHLLLFDRVLTSSLVGMDFVQLRRKTEKLHSSATGVLSHSALMVLA